jgi:NADH-quinone oxidoreductase subunit E
MSAHANAPSYPNTSNEPAQGAAARPVEFTPENKAAFDALLTRYPTKDAVLLPALWLVQRQEGWISEAAMEYVARLLDTAPVKVYSVVSFYTMFHTRPMGRHVIQVCRNISCSLLGARELIRHLEESLGIEVGGTTADGRFSLLTVECLGACGSAPMMQVNDDFHMDLSPGRVDTILAGMK